MSRRRTLPGADELFRATGSAVPAAVPAADPGVPRTVSLAPVADLVPEPQDPVAAPRTTVRAPVRRRPRTAERRPTGRERHEEKITVYVSAEELVDLEQARLTLRADHGLAVDRGRIVREALAVVLADLDATGDASILVRRLTGR
jgi:hypothetical protein